MQRAQYEGKKRRAREQKDHDTCGLGRWDARLCAKVGCVQLTLSVGSPGSLTRKPSFKQAFKKEISLACTKFCNVLSRFPTHVAMLQLEYMMPIFSLPPPPPPHTHTHTPFIRVIFFHFQSFLLAIVLLLGIFTCF